jgi:AGZA family xanthine/uracil permease-like MFS transporter
MLERMFGLKARGSTVRRELTAGATTYLTMCYILFVNPLILGGHPDSTGASLSVPGVMTATAISAGLMCLLMGLYANMPLALAPGMGLNAVVAVQLVRVLGLPWPAAMGVIVLEGLLITLLVLTGVREAVMHCIPMSLKRAIGAGIGLFIALIGFLEAGFVVRGDGTPLTLGTFWGPAAVALVGLLITLALEQRSRPEALLVGILAATGTAFALNAHQGGHLFAAPGAILPHHWFASPDVSTLGQFDLSAVSRLGVLFAALTIFSIMLSDFFDTMGTVIAVGEQAGLVNEKGQMPRLDRILLVDSLAAAVGGASGASSVTTYIESASGVGAGGRTGLTAVVTGLLFLLSVFLNPLAAVVPAQAVAPALIVVGFLMVGAVAGVRWSDSTEAFPAFVTLTGMAFTNSISAGIGFGVVSYTLLKLVAGKAREVNPALVVVTLGFLLYFATPLIQGALRR